MPLPETAMKIAKIAEDEQLVFGWASVAVTKDGALVVDSHGDVILPEELERAAYDYVLTARDIGQRHEGDPIGQIVESIVMTREKAAAMGVESPYDAAWWIGAYVPDATDFAKVKSGEYEMFSIEGTAVTEDVEYDTAAVVPTKKQKASVSLARTFNDWMRAHFGSQTAGMQKQMQSDMMSMLRACGQDRWASDTASVYVDDFDVDTNYAVFCVMDNGEEHMIGVSYDRAEDGSVTLGDDATEVERMVSYRPKNMEPMKPMTPMKPKPMAMMGWPPDRAA